MTSRRHDTLSGNIEVHHDDTPNRTGPGIIGPNTSPNRKQWPDQDQNDKSSDIDTSDHDMNDPSGPDSMIVAAKEKMAWSRDGSIIIHPEAAVCAEAELHGPYPITIGRRSVLQPGCVIKATTGPISIGENCCIEEQVRVINDTGEGVDHPRAVPRPMFIGNFCLLEVKSTLVNCSIGSHCTLGVASRLHPCIESKISVRVGNLVSIGMGVQVGDAEFDPDVYLQGSNAHITSGGKDENFSSTNQNQDLNDQKSTVSRGTTVGVTTNQEQISQLSRSGSTENQILQQSGTQSQSQFQKTTVNTIGGESTWTMGGQFSQANSATLSKYLNSNKSQKSASTTSAGLNSFQIKGHTNSLIELKSQFKLAAAGQSHHKTQLHTQSSGGPVGLHHHDGSFGAAAADDSTDFNHSNVLILQNCVLPINAEKAPIIGMRLTYYDLEAAMGLQQERLETLCAVVTEALQRYHYLKRTADVADDDREDPFDEEN